MCSRWGSARVGIRNVDTNPRTVVTAAPKQASRIAETLMPTVGVLSHRSCPLLSRVTRVQLQLVAGYLNVHENDASRTLWKTHISHLRAPRLMFVRLPRTADRTRVSLSPASTKRGYGVTTINADVGGSGSQDIGVSYPIRKCSTGSVGSRRYQSWSVASGGGVSKCRGSACFGRRHFKRGG